MKDISIFFKPIVTSDFDKEKIGNTIISHTEFDFPTIEKNSIAIFYCPEFRNGYPESQGKSDDRFRFQFYHLCKNLNWNKEIYDLGNLLPGQSVEDTYFALKNVIDFLVKLNCIPIIIGGTHDLILPIYQGYESLEQTLNIVSVDYQTNFGDMEAELSKNNFLNHLLTYQPCYLFNYSVLGLQVPYLKSLEIDLFEKLYFDYLRLGEFNTDFRKAEPFIRNADILTFNLESIKSAEYKAENCVNPNGFYAEQACQISKYAGISDKLSCFSILNVIPDGQNYSSHELIAQMMWYFIDGVSERKGDFPIGTKKEYTKFIVHLEAFKDELVFFKSNKSQRWWMEVPHPSAIDKRYQRHYLVPCNLEDYELALKNELPDLWWRTYQKLK
jgi:formiminoglutamase